MSVKQLFLFAVILLFLIKSGYSQNQPHDSLFAEINQTKDPQLRAKVLLNIAETQILTNTSEALDCAEEACRLSEGLKNDSLKNEAVKWMANANTYLGNYHLALSQFKGVLEYNNKKKDSLRIAESLGDLAYVNSLISEDNVAIEYYQQSIAISKKIGDEEILSNTMNNFAGLYYKWGKLKEANDIFFELLDYYRKTHNKEQEATILGNIGVVFNEMGDYDQSIYYSNQALEIYQASGQNYGIAITLNNLGWSYKNLDQTEKAIEIYKKSLDIRTKLGDKHGIIMACLNLGHAYYGIQQYELAKKYLLQGEETSKEVGILIETMRIYKVLSDTYYNTGNIDQAFNYYKLFKVASDTIFNKEKHQQIEEIRTKFEVDRKEAENRELHLENENQQIILRKNRFILYLSISIAFLFSLFLVLFYQRRRTIYQMKAVVAEQRLLRSQMNPHFIFNAITAIQNYIFTHSPKEAVNYLSAFAGLMRQILENSRKEYIELEDEIKWLENYFALQKLRYSNRFDYQLEVDEELWEQPVLIPPMVIQPFIENAIEHGIKDMEGNGLIKLTYRKSEKVIIVEVDDNGIGILKSKEHGEHRGFALDATKNRLKVLHRKEKTAMQFEIVDKSNLIETQSGTIVRFNLPYRMNF